MSELAYFAWLVTGYFVAVNTIYLVQLVIGWRAVRRRLRSIALEDFRDIRESGIAPPVSIVVPAYNEGKTILESVRSLLALRYPRLEVVVVNDGSNDDTLARRLDRRIAKWHTHGVGFLLVHFDLRIKSRQRKIVRRRR
jgi:cellulose synthase/poly-beta-1,6-N-acetylglucosamine synthase-like glycosyltransferase